MKKGFTLIELLVTSIISTILIVSTIVIFNIGIDMYYKISDTVNIQNLLIVHTDNINNKIKSSININSNNNGLIITNMDSTLSSFNVIDEHLVVDGNIVNKDYIFQLINNGSNSETFNYSFRVAFKRNNKIISTDLINGFVQRRNSIKF